MKHNLKTSKALREKADLTKNSNGLEEVIEKHIQNEKQKFPLRINRQTVIFVAKERCNEEYAKWYRENRMNARKDDRGCV